MRLHTAGSRLTVGLQTWGTFGDVKPMLDLASALRVAGHDVVLAVTAIDGRDYAGECQKLGIRYIRVPEGLGNQLAVLPERLARKRFRPMLKVLMDEALFPFADGMREAARRLCFECDVVVGHFLVYPLKAVARQLGRPYISLTLWPGTIPSAQTSALPLPGILQGESFNAWTWQAAGWLLDRSFGPHIAAQYDQLGLDAPAHVLNGGWFSETLNMICVSPSLWRRAADWAPQHRIVGWMRTEGGGSALADHVEQFLEEGEPPVFMTLGSMQQVDERQTVARLIEVARRLRRRALIQTHVPELLQSPVRGDVCFVEHLDHAAAFPRCSAVLHHGGAGTSQAAVMAGRASVVLPFIPEQASWGRRLQELGLGRLGCSYRRFNAERVAGDLRLVMSSMAMRERADRLSRQMQKENGAAAAVRLIERHAPRRRNAATDAQPLPEVHAAVLAR